MNKEKFLVNSLLLFFGLMMVISGFAMQFGFHMRGSGEQSGRHPEIVASAQYEEVRHIDTQKIVWGLTYSDWSTNHKVVIVIFSLLMLYHIYHHWKWYKGVISKQLIDKHLQVFILTILFLLVAITGLMPWFADLLDSSGAVRILLIEIHDKLAILLFVFLVLHLVKRAKWYAGAFKQR